MDSEFILVKLCFVIDDRCTHGREKKFLVQFVFHTATFHFNFPASHWWLLHIQCMIWSPVSAHGYFKLMPEHNIALVDAYYKQAHATLLVILGITANTLGVALDHVFCSNCIISHIARVRYFTACETQSSSSISSKDLCRSRCISCCY